MISIYGNRLLPALLDKAPQKWYTVRAKERRSKMKKLFSLVIVIITILALPVFSVSAAYSAELTVSKADAKAGETAEVLINLSQSPGLCALGIEVEYNKDALKVISAEFTELFSAASKRVNTQDGRITFNAASADNIEGDGAVAKIVFKVLKDGTHTVSAKPLGDKGFVLHSGSDHALHDVALSINAGHVATDVPVTDAPATDAPVTDSPVTACVHQNTVSETVKASTCSTNGVALVSCADCGISLGEKELPLADHTVGEWETELEPTAEKEGRAMLKCIACGQTVQTKTLDRLAAAGSDTASAVTDGSTATTTDDITLQPAEDNSSAAIIIAIAAVAVAALLIAFAALKAKANKQRRNKEFF